MGAEQLEPLPPPGARFVAAGSGRLYYPVGDPAAAALTRSGLRWFESEEEARQAGLKSAVEDSLGLDGLDGFEVIRELGRGGAATVFHARDRILGREVAIKVVRPSQIDDEEGLARFIREARIIARLHHPCLVAVHSFHRLTAGALALVLEYVPGRTLREVIRAEGPLPVEQAERILRDVGEALIAVHAGGIVHRDVKPQNVFLHESSGRAVLADFGIAVPLQDAGRISRSGAVFGTPAYMSPEQVDGGELDGRSDLYSLGLLGWEMLTGTSPWEGENFYTIIYKQKQVALPPLGTIRPDVPERMRIALEGALEKDRECRWASVGQFLNRLSGGTAEAYPPLSVLSTAKLNPADSPADASSLRLDPEPELASGPAAPVAASRPGIRLRVWAATVAIFSIGAVGLAVASGEMRSGPEEQDLHTSASDVDASTARAPVLPDSVPADPSQAFVLATLDTVFALALGESESIVPPDSVVAAGQGAPPAEVQFGVVSAPPDASSSPEAPPLPVDFAPSSIAAGGMHSCGIDAEGALSCWGGNEWGQLGGGGGPRQSVPLLLGMGTAVRSVVAGGFHSCSVHGSGTTFCWGDNREGQLGGGMRGLDSGPVQVQHERFASVALGIAHTCGISTRGPAYCWGSGEHGQLGTGDTQDRASPAQVATADTLVSLAAGWNHTCALTSRGRALCWGDNSGGQLGDGTKSSRRTPVPVAGNLRFQALVSGSAHSCGLTPEGEALCWGENGDGRLGDGGTSSRTTPTRVLTPLRFVQLTAGGRHTCGVTADRRAYCWGQNNYGQLGDGSTTPRTQPVQVAGEVHFTRLVAGGSHTCGTARDGIQYCWGYNIEGQLGDGTLVHRNTPQRVTLASPESR